MKNLLIPVAVGAMLQLQSDPWAAESKGTPEPPGAPLESSSSSKKPRSRTSAGNPPNRRTVVVPDAKAFSFSRNPGSERAARALIVRHTEDDPKATAQLQEDLAVMTRILEKGVAEYKEDHEEAAGIPIVVLGGSRSTRAMYLEDYGAVFTLTVNIPLRAEPKPDDNDAGRTKAGNEEWNEARNELFGERRQIRADRAGRRDFDPHQLEEFRNDLIDSLRYAANIRNLKPNDWVTVVVRSRGGEEEMERRFDVFLQGGGAAQEAVISTLQTTDELSTMVLRVKKSDIDAGVKQPSNLEEFRKKVSVSLY